MARQNGTISVMYKTALLICFLVLGCSPVGREAGHGVLGAEQVSQARQGIIVCENPAGNHVLRAAEGATDVFRAKELVDKGYKLPWRPMCGGSPCTSPPYAQTCASRAACSAGSCLGWSCSVWGHREDPDDGRVITRVDDASAANFSPYAHISAMLTDTDGNGLDGAEETELAALRATGELVTDWECWEE